MSQPATSGATYYSAKEPYRKAWAVWRRSSDKRHTLVGVYVDPHTAQAVARGLNDYSEREV